MLPVVEAGNVQLVPSEGGTVLDAFQFHPTPGHSVDHMSITLRDGGAAAIFAGGVLHHPVQVARPELSSMFCADPAKALRSREWALDTAAREAMTWFSSHFTTPSAGRIGRIAGGYRWEAS